MGKIADLFAFILFGEGCVTYKGRIVRVIFILPCGVIFLLLAVVVMCLGVLYSPFYWIATGKNLFDI